MGDRTTLDIEVLASARSVVVEAFGGPSYEDGPGEGSRTVRLSFDDVNYGGWYTLSELALAGVAFLASHDAGCDYGAATFAACDGTLAEVPSPQGEIMVGIDIETLEVNAHDLAAVRRYREIRERVAVLFAVGDPPQAAGP